MQLSQTHVLRVAAVSRTSPSLTTNRVHISSFRSLTPSTFRNRLVKLSSTNLHAILYAKPSRKHVQLTTASSAAAGDVAGPTPDEAHASPAFQRTRFLAFAIMVTGYASYYLTRNSLNYVTPVMMQDKALALTYTQIGGLTSILPVCYGASKFASGVLGARTSPTVLLAGGLIATALVNVAFGFGHAYLWFCVCWGANGLLQGLGAPACARFLTAWFAGKERGTFWGFWTASNNVGGFLAPLLAGTAARHYGWRWGMYAPGIVGIAVGLLILLIMKDSPESVGYPPIEPKKTHAAGAKDKPSIMESLTQECLKNPFTWLFAISYFFVYIVRTGVTAWFIHFLIKGKGLDAAAAAVRVSGLELGGLAGSLSAGAISDFVIRKYSNAPSVGLRVKVVIAYAIGTAAALAGFWACPNQPSAQWLAVATVGFFLYGPQMLIGLCGAEVVSPSAVGASQGFLGWISYLGSSVAGLPLSLLLQKSGWGAMFSFLIASCGIVVALLLPMINARSHSQSHAADA